MKNIYSLLILTLFFNVTPSYANSLNKEFYEVKIGILKKNSSDRYFVFSETKTIPLCTKDDNPRFAFGYTIKNKKNKDFKFTQVTYAPTSKIYYGKIKNINRKNDTVIINSPAQNSRNGYAESYFQFDKGDQPGGYKVTIFINNVFFQTILFNVVDATNCKGALQ